AAAGASLGVNEGKENLAMVAIFRAVVPGLAGFKFGMGASALGDGLGLHFFIVFGVVVQDALAGFANNRVATAADFVEDLRTKDHLTSCTLLVSHFGKP